MPTSTTQQTINVLLTPYQVWDAEEQVREWFEDQDENYYNEIDTITIEKEQVERYEAQFTSPPRTDLFLLEVETLFGDTWVVEEAGSLEHCIDFVKRCPGTGSDCRIRKNDSLHLQRTSTEVTSTPLSLDEYWVEVKNDCGGESWAIKAAGTESEMIAFAEHCKPGNYRVRPSELYNVTYEQVQDGVIQASITFHKA